MGGFGWVELIFDGVRFARLEWQHHYGALGSNSKNGPLQGKGMLHHVRILLIFLVHVAYAVHTAAAVNFETLGVFFSGKNAEPYAVSADGSTIVGQGDGKAFRWDAENGAIGLGDLPGGQVVSFALDVSADGSTIVGHSSSEFGYQPFVWRRETGMVCLGDTTGFATAVSADGSTVVGWMDSPRGTEAFIWTAASGMTGLGDLLGGQFWSSASDVSADGSTVVGRGTSGDGQEAFIWTQKDGMTILGDLEGGRVESEAYGVSADGTTVVGRSSARGGDLVFLWDARRGIRGLDFFPENSVSCFPSGMSADGSIIVGVIRGIRGGDFIWDVKHGRRSLTGILEAEGIDLTGWRLGGPMALSSDGKVVVGVGQNPDGSSEVWRITLGEAPLGGRGQPRLEVAWYIKKCRDARWDLIRRLHGELDAAETVEDRARYRSELNAALGITRPFFLDLPRGEDLAGGVIGTVTAPFNVIEVIDGKNCIVEEIWTERFISGVRVDEGKEHPKFSQRSRSKKFWLTGESTKGVRGTGKLKPRQRFFFVNGAKEYSESDGSRKVVRVIEPIDIKKWYDRFTRKHELREWTSASGHTTFAAIDDFEDDTVTLRNPTDKVVAIPLAALSRDDQEYVLSWRESEAGLGPPFGD